MFNFYNPTSGRGMKIVVLKNGEILINIIPFSFISKHLSAYIFMPSFQKSTKYWLLYVDENKYNVLFKTNEIFNYPLKVLILFGSNLVGYVVNDCKSKRKLNLCY